MKLQKVRKFDRRAWEHIGWHAGRNGHMWSKICNQFGHQYEIGRHLMPLKLRKLSKERG